MKKLSYKKFILILTTVNIITFTILSSDCSPLIKSDHMWRYVTIISCQLIIYIITLSYTSCMVKQLNDRNKEVLFKFSELQGVVHTLINKTPSGICVINRDGVIEYLNEVSITLLGPDKTVGMNLLDFNRVKNSYIYTAIKNTIEEGAPNHIMGQEYIDFLTKHKKVFNTFMYPVFNAKRDKVLKVALINYDVTREYNLQSQVETTFMSTIEAFAEAIDARDGYTGEHSKTVSYYTSLICDHLNLDENEKRDILIASSIHDIGKIGIADCILKKPGKLTSEEYEKMKHHPVIGANIICKINGYERISYVLKHHHERWDGYGYPKGLKGKEIPLGSQIISITDAYDAMTSNRIYRKSLGKEKAVQILLDEKDKQFNSELVDLFVNEILVNENKAI